MSIEETDQASLAVAKSPSTRVSLADIEANIVGEFSSTAEKMFPGMPTPQPMALLTVCVIVLKNGFTVIGKSAPADAKNFNAELGHKFAREDAIRQIWPLMGYALREKLAAS